MDASLAKKLRYKEGRALVLNTPQGIDLGIHSEDKPDGTYEFVVLFVNNAAEVIEKVPQVIPHLVDDAVFWICYPKKVGKVKPDVNRDSLWQLVNERTPYRPVSNVAIDEAWSALRFRHEDKVKSK